MAKVQASKIRTVSMTGFGKASFSSAKYTLDCEIKSVNSRFLDIACKLPREYSAFEHQVRELVQSKLQRGRVEIYVSRSVPVAVAKKVVFNQGLFDAYMVAESRLSKKFGGKTSDKASFARELLIRKDILEVCDSDDDIDSEWKTLKRIVEDAIVQLCEMRLLEGRKLGIDLSGRIKDILAIVVRLESLAANTPAIFKERILSRVAKLSPEILIDPTRLAEEVAFMAERVDVTEELVRLRAHLGEFGSSLGLAASGRRLDFLVQEIGRELNTVGSKAQDAAVQMLVVDGKSLVEKIREQAQNIE